MENVEFINYILKIFVIGTTTFYTAIKMDNEKQHKNKIITAFFLLIIPIICGMIKESFEVFNSIICLVVLLVIPYNIYTNNKLGYSILIIMISSAINYVLFIIATILSFIPNKIFEIETMSINLLIISIIYIFMIKGFLNIKKLKNGLSFLKSKINNEYMELLILNISVTILFSIIILAKCSRELAKSLVIGIIIWAIAMFITIQKSLQLYYKQKLLVKELEKVKEELENKEKEVKDLEAENIKISRKNHTLSHKQKSLEYKIQEIIGKSEISKEEVGEIRNRLKEIGKHLDKEKTAIELDKTGIEQIDDMLRYMQSECKRNNIDYELQLKGNIYYMTNNLISKEDLETLLADHIKNAIIAINHTDNINRSILVKLGKIDDTYGLYIYDSGIEFERETLENLGKKPSTTHANEGGTGMGFMNTFDTLRKCNASLTIEEFNEPTSDNYTKALMIKFDNKNEFNIKSYREKVSNSTL